jgi:DNA polymerase elongation subunit (family B)
VSYIDAYHDRRKDIIHVVERRDGQRLFKKFPVPYRLYYMDPEGEHRSVFGDRLAKFETNRFGKFKDMKQQLEGQPTFESDCNVVFRCLSENYKDTTPPRANIAFFDIEVDFDPKLGFSKPSAPYAPVNAVSVYRQWEDTMFTLAVPPDTISWEEAKAAVAGIENTFLFEREQDLLDCFFDLIQDADVLSGWNSTGYDIPYLVNRVRQVMGEEHLRRFCLWGQNPKERIFQKFKKDQQTFDLVGRQHLDYLDLYEKYTYHEIASRKLDYVGMLEVGETKVPYTGTLDQLYKEDFQKFVLYNRQDTALLNKLDRKLKFIDLSFMMATSNGVLLQTTLGSVALIDQAVLNETHDRGYIGFDKRGLKSEGKAAGAFVKDPVKGRHRWFGAVDINSLYPSVIRSLNMSPDTLFGQLVPTYTTKYIEKRFEETKSGTDAWHNVFGSLEYQMVMDRTDDVITVAFERDSQVEMTAREIYEMIFEQGHPLSLSGNGTIFRTDTEGIIPGLLSRWYADRKVMQKKAKDLKKAVAAEKDPETLKSLSQDMEYWDKMQLVRKILLNSAYGALLNEACRQYDPRIGQSVTLTGRCITRHMISKINDIADGDYTIEGRTTIYGDTDSAYFSLYPLRNDKMKDFDWTVENVVTLYDDIGEQVNTSFPPFMAANFNTGLDRGAIIAAGREIVAKAGIFIKKKRYACLVVDTEGVRHDVDGKPGKIKAMGVETQRSDTPKFIQDFLKKILEMVLTDKTEQEVVQYISDFRYNEFRQLPPWRLGRPTSVNGLSIYQDKATAAEERIETLLIDPDLTEEGAANMPGHHRAGINWNRLRAWNDDVHSLEVNDGAKVIVCDLKPNNHAMDSIARPVDQEEHALPDWFKTLPFDTATMERKLIDDKLENLIGILDWDIGASRKDTAFAKLMGLPEVAKKKSAAKSVAAKPVAAFANLFKAAS